MGDRPAGVVTAAVDSVALRARRVSVERDRRTVVHDLSLTLHRGEIVALIGPNGAGKSTLLAALAGLVAPSEGSIETNGRVAAALQAPALARRSVCANVEAGLAWWGVARTERRDQALAALERCGAGQLAGRSAATLSGGETRRVHLARALAVDPDVLLLDEPFAGLDVSARGDLLYDASSALRSDGRATLVVVHDRGEAWALADRVIVLIDGRIRAEGSPTEVFEHPPSPAAAAFVGFEGCLEELGGVRMFKASHVTIDPDGAIEGRVARRIPLEDGFRIELEVDTGRLVAVTADPTIRTGETLRLRLDGGACFPTAASTAPVHAR
jgi:ABC-type sulfate/molybdate transport systems ATPase subunit